MHSVGSHGGGGAQGLAQQQPECIPGVSHELESLEQWLWLAFALPLRGDMVPYFIFPSCFQCLD